MTPLPSVIVKDQNGAAMAGANVLFTVVGGNGSVTGATATTNASGIATVGSWTLGIVSGSNILAAAAGNLTPITFTALGAPGAPASLTKTAGDNQTANGGRAVAVRPTVVVRDVNGNPVPGVTVTFAVASGGGNVTGPQQVSDVGGAAAVESWTLGAVGMNLLTATIAGISVTFTATAIDPCAVRTPHPFGTTTTGQLTPDDCRISGSQVVDYHLTTLPSAGAYTFLQTSPTLDSYLGLYGAAGFLVGFADDVSATDKSARLKAILLPGAHSPATTTYPNTGSFGAYSLTSAATTSDVTNCEEVFVERGITTNQALQMTDCAFQSERSDEFSVILFAGQTVTISMTSTAVDALLYLVGPTGLVVATNNNRDGTTTDAQIVFTPTTSSNYYIETTSNIIGRTGAYTLSISAAPAASILSKGQPSFRSLPPPPRAKGSALMRRRR